MRHGETDWPLMAGRARTWPAANHAPLTECGEQQIVERCADLHGEPFREVVSSPMTRAMQSAAIASSYFRIPLRVDPDLHEWLADVEYASTEPEDVEARLHQMRIGTDPLEYGGHPFESPAILAERVWAALGRSTLDGPVLVVSHEVALWSITGRHLGLGEVVWLPAELEPSTVDVDARRVRAARLRRPPAHWLRTDASVAAT